MFLNRPQGVLILTPRIIIGYTVHYGNTEETVGYRVRLPHERGDYGQIPRVNDGGQSEK